MSLLEDIFLQDEAGEAQELERIIEGDEYDERPRSPQNSDDNSEKEDEAEEDKRRVDPATTKTKREVKNPRFVLNPARLTGPRGIQVIPEHFKDFKFKGKGHEKEDLDLVLKKLEHWAYRLYPKFQFEDCLKKIETLGKKRPVMVHLHKIRSDQLVTEDAVVQQDSSDDEAAPAQTEEDEFDKLLQQQIELARATPAKPADTPVQTPGGNYRPNLLPSVPKATSSPSISDEQRERMILNRKLAEERRLAKLRALNDSQRSSIDNKHEETVPRDSDTVKDNIGNSFVENGDAESNGQTNKENEVPTIISEGRRSNDSKNAGNNDSDNNDWILAPANERHANKTDDKIETYDLTKGFDDLKKDKGVGKTKKNRPYVINNSDSDSDGDVTINETVSVDIHKVASQVESGSNIYYEISTIDLVGSGSTEMNGKVYDANSEVVVIEDQVKSVTESSTEIKMIDIVDEINKPDKTRIIDTVEDCAMDAENISDDINSNDQNESDTNEETSPVKACDNIETIETKDGNNKEETAENNTVPPQDIKDIAMGKGTELDSEKTEKSNNFIESNKNGNINEETKDQENENKDVGQESENIDDIMDIDFSDDF